MSVTKVSSPMIESGTKGADIASAATVVIGTDGSYFDITGTTGISTQFTVDAGRRFTLQFDGAVVITDNAAITLAGAANFTTAAGDILSFVATAANTVVQTGYSLVDGGSPVASGGVPDATRPCFGVTMAPTVSNVTGNGTTYTMVWTVENFDQGSHFASNSFTAPSTGKYLLGCTITTRGWDGNEDLISLNIVTSNRIFYQSTSHTDLISNSRYGYNQVVVTDMDASDTAHMTLYVAGSSGDIIDLDGQAVDGSNLSTYFFGCLVA